MSLFKKAKNEQGKIKANIYGKAGSGKSFTSLLIAEGLAKLESKNTVVIESEKGYEFYSESIPNRKVHPEAFNFGICRTKSIYEATDAAKEAIGSKDIGIIIVDSVSEYYEAAKAAWPGKMNSNGAYPIYAWKWIYNKYDEFINPLLDCDKHVLFCGRLGDVYSSNKDEMKVIGQRMKAKKEQAYETQMLLQMKNEDNKFYMYAEKDRSSVLLGKTIESPNYENTIALVMPFLSGTNVPIKQSDDTEKTIERQQKSFKELEKMCGKIGSCANKADLEKLTATLAASKKVMEKDDITQLTKVFVEKRDGFDSKANSVLDKIK